MRANPAATRRRTCQTMSGLPPTSSNGLGSSSVSGRMRSPRPAARIIAIMGGSEGVTDRGLARFELVQQARERRQFVVARARAAKISHDARHVLQVAVLAVAMVEAGKNAEHLDLPLHAHPLEIAPEGAEVGRDR